MSPTYPRRMDAEVSRSAAPGPAIPQLTTVVAPVPIAAVDFQAATRIEANTLAQTAQKHVVTYNGLLGAGPPVAAPFPPLVLHPTAGTPGVPLIALSTPPLNDHAGAVWSAKYWYMNAMEWKLQVTHTRNSGS